MRSVRVSECMLARTGVAMCACNLGPLLRSFDGEGTSGATYVGVMLCWGLSIASFLCFIDVYICLTLV